MASLRRAQTAIRARGNNKCPRHQGKEVVFVCQDCEGELICTKCVSTIHKKHAVEEICDVIPQVKVTIQDFVNKTENAYIPEFRGEMRSVDSKLTRNKKHFKDVIGKIQKQNESLNQELDKITNKLIKLCREIEEQNNDLLRNHKAELQKRIQESEARIHELRDTLQTGTDTQVYDTSREIPNDVTIPALPSLQDTEFYPTSVLIVKLENLMGQLSTTRGGDIIQIKSSVTPGPNQHGNVEVHGTSHAGTKNVTSEYTATKKSPASNKTPTSQVRTFKPFKTFTLETDISGIHSASDNQVWVQTKSDVLQLLDHTGHTQKTKKMEVHITKFCVSPSTGHIWFYCFRDHSIRKVTGDKSTVMFNTESAPLCICISADGNILVGMNRQIVKYTQRGQILCKSTQVKQVPVVRCPDSISPCPITRNIAVMDWDSISCGGDDRKHVSILSEDLQLLCTYYGRDKEWFCPYDVCYSDTGNIYLADYCNGAVQQISGTGEFICTVHVYTGSYNLAVCLCAQPNGDIWTVFGGDSVIILRKE